VRNFYRPRLRRPAKSLAFGGGRKLILM
jgi:hypothetical protein